MDFPTDLLEEIFIRMPCKNVAICKCVCKSLYKLLSHPDFTANYALNSPFTTFLIEQVDARVKNQALSLLQISQKGGGELICTPIKPGVPGFRIGKLGKPCLIGKENGLLFLLLRGEHLRLARQPVREKIYFFNPLTEECVQVVDNQVLVGAEWWFEYNIGFVPAINVYKILRFSYQSDYQLLEAMIFTVGVDSEWRVSDDRFAFWFPLSTNGANFRGFYHWVPKNDSDSVVDWICTFDFLEEKCSGIPKPIELEKLSFEMMYLRVFNNRLSLIDFSNWRQLSIWTMGEYGVAESWSKKVISDSLVRGAGHDLLHLLTVLPNGNVVLYAMGSNTFISIDTNKDEATEFEVVGVDPDCSSLFATKFVPRFC